nr:XRE family transcriptional regulator [uncultured Peptostreptococcus sp.]
MDKDLFVFRLKTAMKNKSISQYTMSKLSGINRGTLSSYMSGKYLPKQDKIFILADILDVNPDWLACNSDKINKPIQTSNQLLDQYIDENFYPYVDAGVSAGSMLDIEAQYDLEKIKIPDILLGKYAGRSDIILMRVNGESMNKLIPNGSLIALVTNINPSSLSDGDIVVFSYNYEYSVKIFVKDKINKMYIFKPESYETCFKDIIIPFEQAQNLIIIGKVIMYNTLL